ncbi:hypothetical protein NX059_007011 [Plenodomus lindquistii]|nr:hypothetical protein NX059_007011 [Plenodomus lindquistii]
MSIVCGSVAPTSCNISPSLLGLLPLLYLLWYLRLLEHGYWKMELAVRTAHFDGNILVGPDSVGVNWDWLAANRLRAANGSKAGLRRGEAKAFRCLHRCRHGAASDDAVLRSALGDFDAIGWVRHCGLLRMWRFWLVIGRR